MLAKLGIVQVLSLMSLLPLLALLPMALTPDAETETEKKVKMAEIGSVCLPCADFQKAALQLKL